MDEDNFINFLWYKTTYFVKVGGYLIFRFYIILNKKNKFFPLIFCKLLRAKCPVYYENNNSCIIPEYKDFKLRFKKTLEDILKD